MQGKGARLHSWHGRPCSLTAGSEKQTIANDKDKAVPVTGGCLCGAVRFAGQAFMRNAYYCHCTICQKTSGEPFEIGVLIKAGTLQFTKGAPAYYQSSSFGKRGFSAVCGSRLLWAPTDTRDEWATNVAVCALDNPADVLRLFDACPRSGTSQDSFPKSPTATQ